MFLFVFVLILLSLLMYKRHQHMSIFTRLAIPGPKPNFIFGNAIDIASQGFSGIFPKWTKKYGPIVGFYIGGRPQVLITDFELIRRVMIKDFQVFRNRNQYIPGGVHPQPQLQKMLVWQEGNAWKHLRASMSPAFSSSKLNSMEPLMISSIDNMMNELNNKAKLGQEFDLKPIVSDMTFSAVTKCIFGLNFSLIGTSKEAKAILDLTQTRLEKSILAMALLLFPSLSFIAHPLRVWWETIRLNMLWSPEGICYDIARKIVKLRRDTKSTTNDFLQILMDTNRIKLTREMDLEMTSEEIVGSESLSSKEVTNEKLSEEEIVANSLLFLVAGFETTSVTLQFIIQNLVNHPHVQEKLRKEIKIAMDLNHGEFESKTVSRIPLLNHVIKETLRMYPPVSPFMSRVAEKDYEYEGIVIPKGTGVLIGVSAIHNDPQFWPEPEKFIPERFENEINKLAYLPFGVG